MFLSLASDSIRDTCSDIIPYLMDEEDARDVASFVFTYIVV